MKTRNTLLTAGAIALFACLLWLADAKLGGYQSLDQTYRQRMKMVRFLYPIPAYTKPTPLPVSISKAAAGTSIQLRIPRPWSRPPA